VFSAENISRLLSNYKGKIRAIVPLYAMSGGTILALSCDEIKMGEGACLGPTDVQVGSLWRFGSSSAWRKLLRYKKKKVSDDSVILEFMARQYDKSVRAHLQECMRLPCVRKKAFIDLITKGGVEHGYQITPNILRAYGFCVGRLGFGVMRLLLRLLNNARSQVLYL
jgi:ClpP class serine protease